MITRIICGLLWPCSLCDVWMPPGFYGACICDVPTSYWTKAWHYFIADWLNMCLFSIKYYRLPYFSCTLFVSYVFINVGTFSRFRALCNICTPFQYSHALPIKLPCECHHFYPALTVPFNNIQHCSCHQRLHSLFIHLLFTCQNSVKLFSLPVFFGNVHNLMLFPRQSNIILSSEL